jgi:hypothetical protein
MTQIFRIFANPRTPQAARFLWLRHVLIMSLWTFYRTLNILDWTFRIVYSSLLTWDSTNRVGSAVTYGSLHKLLLKKYKNTGPSTINMKDLMNATAFSQKILTDQEKSPSSHVSLV